MVLLVQSDNLYENDLRAMIMAFFPCIKIHAVTPRELTEYDRETLQDVDFIFTALFDNEKTRLHVEEKGHVIFSAYTFGEYNDRKRFRNKLKLASYKLLVEYTGRTLPWGSMTGMRPTKIATRAYADGLDTDDIIDIYRRTYDVSPEKAGLAAEVARRERMILSSVDPQNDYCLYIGIPFCPTRCVYCSFTSYPILEYSSRIEDYIDTVKRELENVSLMNHDRRLAAVYIGGGTPTAISAEQLDRLLTEVDYAFDMEKVDEYTVEAGRPDSITLDKLEVMKKHGVTRISINPQSMNMETLKKIGRAHTPDMIRRAMKDARLVGFDNINMDIIAGLPGETLGDMAATLDEINDMAPESLTVHSLAIKKKAALSERYEEFRTSLYQDVDRMQRLAESKARDMGLLPYYLYRQKNISGNLENIGFAMPGAECRYNVLIMEERIDIMAVGAGSVSRLLRWEDGRVAGVDRIENLKNIDEYISRIDEMVERKSAARE